MNNETFTHLYQVLENRKKADPTSSYTASLYNSGLPTITRKVMEEAYETVEAAYLCEYQGNTQDNLIKEIADLWYHTLVLACQQNLKLDDILKVLEERKEKSGHEEKRSREQ